MTIHLKKLDDWEPIAEFLSKEMKVGDWLRLEGDLGAGKTSFVRYYLRALGYEEEVASPSYPIMIEYEFESKRIIHMDGYRLNGPQNQAWDFREWGDAILIAEWADQLGLPLERFNWQMKIRLDETTGLREVDLLRDSKEVDLADL